MINLLEELVKYLASTTGLVAGQSAFYNEMLETPAKCILIQELPTSMYVPVQIDAELHKIKLTARDISNTTAKALAVNCWQRLLTNDETFDNDPGRDITGFITLLDGTTIQVSLYGAPVWERADQQGRKYFTFYAVVLCKR